MCLSDTVGKRCEPSFRLPLVRIRAPYFGIAIRGPDSDGNIGVVWYSNVVNLLPVYSSDWCSKGQHDLLA